MTQTSSLVSTPPEARFAGTVGVIGLGNLGLPVSRRLEAVGVDVIAFDLSPAARGAATGIRLAPTVKDVAIESNVVLILVSDADQCTDVISGADGLLSGTQLPAVVVIMATIGPDAVTDLATPLEESGVGVIDAPVSGGAEAAVRGELSLMVAGAQESIETCQNVLESLGAIHFMGRMGAGQNAKLANQIVFFGTQAAIQEALDFAKAIGIDEQALLQALSEGTADCWSVRHPGFLQATAKSYESAGIAPHRRSWHKDLRKACEATVKAGVEAPLTELIADSFGSRIDRSVGKG